MNCGADSKLFEELTRDLLERGIGVRFRAHGASMSPAIRDGEIVEITPVIVSKLRKDDIVLAKSKYGFRLHRIVCADHANDVFVTRGDCGQQNDPALTRAQILGVARAKEVRVGRIKVRAQFRGVLGWALRCAARGQIVVTKRLTKMGATSPAARLLTAVCLFLLAASGVRAQVALDSSSSAKAIFTNAGVNTLTFTHTTTTTANRVLLVGVSMDISSVATATVTSVTYNGTGLAFAGAHNDAGNTRRVETWYLLAPASGTQNVIVSVNLPSAGTLGVVAGASTFTDVDQTVPLGSFVSADGAAGAYSQLDVPGVVNGMILDTLATGGNQTVTVPGPQVQQWNLSTGTTATDVTATASSRTGAPSVPVSETFNGTSNWSLGAISINPSTADIGVSTSVSAVALGQNSTYTITVTNNGPSAANNVTLTDTFAATNLTFVSFQASNGTNCTQSTTLNCTLPNPFASGATATVTVVVSASQAGFYPNTATITDSGTPPDPNTGNNSYVALAPVVSVVCGTSTIGPAPAPLTGVINTYYPGTASVAAGATSIPVGTSTGAGGTIATGSLLLVIQMQNASINTSDTVAYGNGSTGAGFTTINNSGDYEFVTTKGPISGGSVQINGAGANGGLVFGYTAAAASATQGQSTYQVVLVPQYTSATLSSTTPPTAAAWNGSTGGILALDIAGQLNLGGATVVVDGLGFRGGAGMELVGNDGGSNADYVYAAPATYTGAAENGVHAPKGEGVAGTPLWVASGTTYLNTGSDYPSGTAGTDGSMARGAPANGGAGGTDADPPANDQNAGGGGGGNGGSGGFGGDSWNTNLSTGGEGGSTFPSTIDRIAMGGGGGAGTRNNDDGIAQASSGAAGGGIIFIRADSFTGTGALTANGASAFNGTANDAGGGGGAGGTIVMLAANGGEGGLTLQANGGNGGNAWETEAFALTQRHGPGGGGGGGVIFVSGTPANATANGGVNGLTLNTPAVPYGSTPGNGGIVSINATLSQVTGIQSDSLCAPDLTLTKSHVGNFVRGSSANYTITVSNVGPFSATSGIVNMNDTLPVGVTPTAASGTGWTCSVSGQTASCTRSDPLAPLSSYPAVTVAAVVSQSAPATVTNIATVDGGGEANLTNDTATDIANVVSLADISVADAASPNPVSAGGNITYTMVVTNNGPSAADNATLVANIPGHTSLVSMSTAAGWSCQTPVGGVGTIVCNNVNLPALTSSTFTLIVTVNSNATNGTIITDTVSASSSVSDRNPLNNTATVTTEVGTTANAQLNVTNSASPSPVQAGGNITYTQVVTNTGSSAATNATFTENTPANTTLVGSISAPSGWSCTAFPPQCTNPSVGAGVSGTFTAAYQVKAGTAAGTTITDTATVNASNQAFGANSATATDVVAAATQADLALSTAATPQEVLAGNNISYTQIITNNGPAAATSVSFTEATPANTTFQSVLAPAGWTCTQPAVGGTGTVNCTDPSLAPGTVANIIVVVNVPATVAPGTITASSSIAASSSDPNLTNNSTTIATAVADNCDLAVTNSGTPNPITAGAQITYSQVVTNGGPSNCSAGTLSEATPANTTFVSVAATTTGGGTWNCPNSAPVACTNPSVVPGSIGTITAVYQVNGGTGAGTVITDTVNVGTNTVDTNTSNNSASVSIGVTSGADADMSITNSGTPNPVTAGGTITYTQVVTNGGNATAARPITVTETLPTGETFFSLAGVSTVGTAGWNCTTVAPYTCTATRTMAKGASATFTLVVTVSSTVTPGSSLTEIAGVTSATTDPNPNNNNASVTTYVAGSADLSVTNAVNTTPAQDSSTLVYTQVVKNAGPSTATNVQLTETLPTDTTATNLTTGATGWTCTLGTLTCSNASLAPNATATITFTVTVNPTAPAGTALNQTATVISNVADPNTTNNSATVVDVVAGSGQADLVVTNSATPTSVTAGSSVTYTQTVQNLGPATATSVTFSEPIPPNTTVQTITGPGGTWSCSTVTQAENQGSVSCTDTGFATGTANFKIVLLVNANTPSGTSITDTATATASNIVPNLTTNSASATVVVANANSADMAIVKTANLNPVIEGTPLTYTLTVTNNGPASATNVTVTDTLPSVMTYLSSTVSGTTGSCSEAGGTVTCLLGTMANAAVATINILTIPEQPGVVSNTATVTADQTDPTLANNSSTQTETVTYPTAITLQSLAAVVDNDKNGASCVIVTWKTGGEAHNFGFNVYREVNGNRVRVNSSLIAGSALLMSGALPKHSGKSYAWIDALPAVAGTSYWLEDVDVNGARTMHGPISVSDSADTTSQSIGTKTKMFSELGQGQLPTAQESHVIETIAKPAMVTNAQLRRQFQLAANPAVKILVQHEGWYRITQLQLVQAGLDPNVDPSTLHLYAEANEQPIEITGATAGPGGFGPNAALSFYGTGIDTEYSGTRVYWLVAGEDGGVHVTLVPTSSGSNQPPVSYRATVELRQHTTYFAALLTQTGQNFFGALVSPTAVQQTISVSHLDPNSMQESSLEVSLQGIIGGFPHDVSVVVNGSDIGDITFTGQEKGHLNVSLPPGLLQEGNNTVTLTALNGEYDTSLVDFIRITYPHQYVADSDQLKFTGRAGDEIVVNGFTAAPIVLDITDPSEPAYLTPRVTRNGGNYSVAFQVPWTTTNLAHPGWHTLLALGSNRVASPVALRANHPSHWYSAQAGADIAMITYDGFAQALAPLVRAHEAGRESALVVPISELYDEFNFGERSPFAIRDFLRTAVQNWKKPPHYLLLNGRASFDPRNYLGFGQLDLVPTDIFPSSSLMTASDDWFSDFSGAGMPTMATGRIPAATLSEDETAIEKIAGYERYSKSGPWTSHALMVADRDDSESFTQDTRTVQAQLPSTMQANDVFVGVLGTAAAQQQLIDGINSGQLLVNYLGHGSEEQWSGSDIFNENSVDALTNESQLPVFLIMDCLNGFFQDVYSQPLGVTLLLAPNGGAVAVLASSGLNQPSPQTRLDKLVVGNVFAAKDMTIGQSILKAKSQIKDLDVRKTFVLLGDPAMKLKEPDGSSR